MIDFSYINQAPIKECLSLQNSCAKHIALSPDFPAEQQPMQAPQTDAEAYSQLDLGHASLHTPFSVLFEVTFGETGVGEERLRQVSQPPLWWHWLSGMTVLGGGCLGIV